MKFDKHFKMTEKDALLYAKEQLNIFDEGAILKATEIGDGNINYVFKVWDIDTGKSVIIKHADILLRSSGRPLDVNRNKIEANILMLQSKYAPDLVPEIYKYDPIMCALVMEDISDFKNLRTELLNRKIFPKLADDISSFLTLTLLPTTDIAMDPKEKKDLVKEFINKDLCDISEDLVFTEPYIDYKGQNIVLDENIDFVKKEIYENFDLILEVGKLKNNFMNNAQALIHGDLHSGSIFVNQKGTKVLDPEFAFYGPIGYDIGNVIAHLCFAWINAEVTETDKHILSKFQEWINITTLDLVAMFKIKYSQLYPKIVSDPMAKNSSYQHWYLDKILEDTAGYAGLEIIRRVVGDSKVADITEILDIKKRVKAERILIKGAIELIKNRVQIKSGEDYLNIFKKHL